MTQSTTIAALRQHRRPKRRSQPAIRESLSNRNSSASHRISSAPPNLAVAGRIRKVKEPPRNNPRPANRQRIKSRQSGRRRNAAFSRMRKIKFSGAPPLPPTQKILPGKKSSTGGRRPCSTNVRHTLPPLAHYPPALLHQPQKRGKKGKDYGRQQSVSLR